MIRKSDIEAYKNFQKTKKNNRQQTLDARYEKAKTDFDKIVKMIITKYHPKSIYQWGSLLEKSRFSEISDIDIALEGIPNAETYVKLTAEALEYTDFPLDIVEIEHIHPLHRDMIIKTGQLIYEKNES
jgi:predicted nucleotidyltransferase